MKRIRDERRGTPRRSGLVRWLGCLLPILLLFAACSAVPVDTVVSPVGSVLPVDGAVVPSAESAAPAADATASPAGLSAPASDAAASSSDAPASSGASADAADAASPAEPVRSLADLNCRDIYTRTALEHIFLGTVNARGVASGYHYEGFPGSLGEVVPGTRTEPDANGIYEARVEVDGIAKSGNRGRSTFFPRDWSPQEVVDAIEAAYDSRMHVNGNIWAGAGGGIGIQLYLDDGERIISAFPERGG